MEARNLKSREYNTDIFGVRAQTANGSTHLYDPHPFLKDQQNAETRTRTSFQDSNIFGYKEDKNVTWQGTGRADKSAGIRTEDYRLAAHTPGHVLYNPEAGMAVHQTHTKRTHVEPERDLYTFNDPRVPKSRLGEEVFGVRDFDRQAAKKDLLSGDVNWLKHNQFERDTAEKEQMRPEDRKQKELASSYANHGLQANPTKPKEYNMETMASWKDPKKSAPRSNIPQEVNTFAKRAEELSSMNNPLSTTDYSQYTPQTKTQQVYENVDDRVRNAMYSDLYNQTGHLGSKGVVQNRSEVHSMTGIFSKEGQSKGTRWGEDVTAAERRQDFLRTTGFPTTYESPTVQKKYANTDEINQARTQLRMPKVIKGCELESTSLHSDEFYKKYNVVKDHRETNVVSLRFTNLPGEMDAETLRAMSGTKHIVRAAVKTDNIKNQCTGEGEITIRLSEGDTKDDIIARYAAAGIHAEDKPEAEKRKSNYKELATTGWRDSRLEFEEKRHVNTGWENQKVSKVNNLNSNFNIGTNDTMTKRGDDYVNVVRNRQDNLWNEQNFAENQNQLMYNWDRMRPNTAAAVTPSGGDRSFMRPTESFDSRKRAVMNSIQQKYY